MPWQTEWLHDAYRARLRDDLADARRRGRVPVSRRLSWWAGVGAAALLSGAPEAVVPGVVVFEVLLAPLLSRRPRRTMGPLAPWRPPDSWRPSPEAPVRSTGRP